MDMPLALRFAEAVRTLTNEARACGLVVPAFRSPPRTPGATRSLRRLPGGLVVSVVLRGRPFEAVCLDLVDGVLAANSRLGADAAATRAALLAALLGPAVTVPAPARVAEWQTQAA